MHLVVALCIARYRRPGFLDSAGFVLLGVVLRCIELCFVRCVRWVVRVLRASALNFLYSPYPGFLSVLGGAKGAVREADVCIWMFAPLHSSYLGVRQYVFARLVGEALSRCHIKVNYRGWMMALLCFL